MDSYDAIIEQLKKAQQRGVEAVTNRLDFVLESLEGVIQEAREAIQEAIPTDAEELFPVVEASEAVERARTALAEMEDRLQELQTRPEAAAVSAPETVSLGLLRRLDAARSQSEMLRGLLPLLLDHVGRAAVLVVRERTINAWSGIGFAAGARLGEWKAGVEESEALRRLVDEAAVVEFSPAADPVFSGWLEGEEEALEGMLVPVSLSGRVVGGLYVDRLEGGPWSPDTVQSLVAVSCWLIDTLKIRSTVPSPMLREAVVVGAPEVAAPVAEPEAEAEEEAVAEAEPTVGKDEPTPETGYPPVTAEEPEPEAESEWAPPEETAPAEAEFPEEPTEERAAPPPEPMAEEEPEVRMPAGFDPSATMRVDTGPAIERVRAEMEAAREAEQEEAEAEEPAAEAPGPEAVEDASLEAEAPAPPPVEAYTPPPVKPVVPPPPLEEPEPAGHLPVSELSPEEQAQHEEAQRFARLLVSEIKLYNPEEVDKGRSNHDLYQRLKEDIDRSREMFERRVTEQVRSVHDYFQDELVRILADGDEDALGM